MLCKFYDKGCQCVDVVTKGAPIGSVYQEDASLVESGFLIVKGSRLSHLTWNQWANKDKGTSNPSSALMLC